MSIASRGLVSRQRLAESSDTHPSPMLRPMLGLLPVELYLQIVQELDYASTICLKLTCKRFYEAIPMPAPPHVIYSEQRLTLLRLIPPPVRRDLTPYMLCYYCLKYHAPDWPVWPAFNGWYVDRHHCWILSGGSRIICTGCKPKAEEGEKIPTTKPCGSCWAAFSPTWGVAISWSTCCSTKASPLSPISLERP